jgi:hypothetical protein
VAGGSPKPIRGGSFPFTGPRHGPNGRRTRHPAQAVNFLTCFAYPAQPGEVEVEAEHFIGLRGWCKVGHYEKAGKTYNRIDIYYTDKEKFPRAAIDPADVPVAAGAESANPWD